MKSLKIRRKLVLGEENTLDLLKIFRSNARKVEGTAATSEDKKDRRDPQRGNDGSAGRHYERRDERTPGKCAERAAGGEIKAKTRCRSGYGRTRERERAPRFCVP